LSLLERELRAKPLERQSVSPPIAVQGLSKRYGSQLAVDDLSFDVPAGKVTGFLGPNGAGKTTTLRMLLGLAAPTAGTATILGRPYRHLKHPSLHVGAVIDSADFHPLRTGRDHLRVLAATAGIDDVRVEEVLALVDLGGAAGKKVGQFSLGMRQRLGLAAALLGDPEVLVADEPANGLDPAGIRWLRQLLRSFAQSGRAVFVSSHILGEMAQLADEVVVINHGRLIVHAPVAELTDGPHLVRVRTPDVDQFATVMRVHGIETRIVPPDRLVIPDVPIERVGTLAAEAGLVMYGLEPEASSLEEAFLELTSGEEGIR
jgi:ABC-2 type transport system ATP-binding protein